MSVNKNFLTQILIGWKKLLTDMDFHGFVFVQESTDQS